MSSEWEGLGQPRAPGRAGRALGLCVGSPALLGCVRVAPALQEARARVPSRGAGRRLEGRWWHSINSGAKELRGSSRSPLLSFAGDSRRASASGPLY